MAKIVKDGILRFGLPAGILAVVLRLLFDCNFHVSEINWSLAYDIGSIVTFGLFLIVGIPCYWLIIKASQSITKKIEK